MARLTASQRRALPKSAFGVPSKAPGPGSYPMPDRQHAGIAKGYASRFASSGQQSKIDAKADRVLSASQRRRKRKKV